MKYAFELTRTKRYAELGIDEGSESRVKYALTLMSKEKKKKTPYSPSKLRFLFSLFFVLLSLLFLMNCNAYADGDIYTVVSSDVGSGTTTYTFEIHVVSNNTSMGTVTCDPHNDGSTTEYSTSKVNNTDPVSVTITANANDGYEFDRWEGVESEGSTQTKDVYNLIVQIGYDEEWTYTAYFKAKVYNVTFNSNGGTSVTSTTITYNSPLNSIKPADPTKSGYVFGGWYYDEACTQAVNWNANYTRTSTTTLYAKWNCNTNPVTSFSLAASQNNFCYGGQTTLTTTLTGDFPSDATKNYAWKLDGTPISGTGATNTVTPPSGTNNYSVTATISYGTGAAACSADKTSNTVTVTVKSLPSVSISGADAICSGSSTTLTASQTNISAWRWSHSSTASSYQVSVSPNSTTTYTVTVTGTNGCTNTASKTVTVNALPDAPTASGNSRCGEGTVQLTATAPSGSTCDWYSVATGGDPVSTSTTTYTTPSISSTQNYYVVSRNTGTGCVSSSRTHVIATVNPVPSLPSVTAGSNCGPGTVSLSATVGTDGTTCKWYDSDTGATVVATGTSYSPNLTNTTTYYVSSYNATTTCESPRVAVTATIKTIPTVAVDPTSVTVGRTSTGTTTTTLTASGATSYSWYKDALSVGSGESFTTPNDLSEGEHTYQVVGTTNGCSNTATATVTVVMPAVTLNEINASPAVLCKNENSTLTATASSSKGTVDWSWISSSGSNYSGYQITVTPDVTTTYTVTATARAASVTATATKTVTITVNSRPAAPTLTGVTRAADTFIVCNSNSITLTANPGTGNTCKWYNAGGTMVYEGNSYQINSLSAGIYDYTVSAKNTYNCESTNRTPAVAVIGANPTISNVNHTDISCHDANDGKIEVEASQTPPGNQLLYTRSNWFDYRTDGNFEDLEGGTYTIKVKDNFGCETTWSSQVTIVNPDALTLTIVSGSKDQQKCAGNAIDSITFNSNGTMTATVLPAGLSFNSSTGVLSGEPTATGDNSYTITATNANNCGPLTITGTITKYSLPNVTVTADASTLGRWPDTRGATQTTLRASGASTYTWYKASENLGTGSTYTTPSTLTDGTYTYKVIGTDDHSCSNTATTTVTVVTPAVTLSDITATETVLCHQGSTELTTSTQSYTGTSEVSYSWSGTGLTSTTGATVSASQLSNTTTAPITNTYTVTATATAGSGANAATATATKSIDIKVYPKVVMKPLPNDTVICNAKTISKMSFSSTLPADSMTYTWSVETSSNNVFAIRAVAPKDTLRDGVGDFPSSKIKNSYKKQTVTICVVPHYGHAPNMCSGDTLKRVITVYPAVSTTFPTINSMCSQTDMDIKLVTKIKDAGGTYSYEWKVYSNRITGEGLQSSKTSGDSVFYINARNISNAHNVTKSDSLAVRQYYTAYGDTLECMSSWQYKKITVYPNPGMNAVSPSDDQYICHDGTMNEVTLSSRITDGTMSYEWTRDNNNIGGLRNGTSTNGKIKDSVLTNISNSEQTTAVSVRPIYTSSSNKVCRGSDDSVKTFKIHVSPKAVMTDLSSHTQTLCHGEALSTVNFGTNIDPSGNVLYKWSRDNTNIGGIDASCESSCTGISSDAVTNTTNTAQATTITVTPKYYSSNFSSCNWETSSDRTFTVTVNPKTEMTATPNSDVISHDSLLTVTFNTNITDGTRTFHWKRDNNAVSQWNMEGTGNISVHPENTTSTPQVVNVKAWLSYSNGGETCTTSSDTVRFTITVNPRITMSASPEGAITCSGTSYTPIAFSTPLNVTSSGASITYKWTRTNDNITGLASSGESTSISAILSTTQTSQQTTHFVVTPWYSANGIECAGEPVEFDIKLKVAPTVSITQPAAICSGDTISSTETINDHGGTLSVSKWQKKHGDTWSDFDLSTPLNYENNGDKLRYVVENECGSNNSEERTITVNPSPATPTIEITQGAEDMCYGDDLSLTATSTGAGSFVWSGEDANTGYFNGGSSYDYKRTQSGVNFGTVDIIGDSIIQVHSNQPENEMQIRWNFDGLNPAEYKYVQIRYKTIGQTPGEFRVCVRTENNTSLRPFTSVAFINDDQWHVMTINASGSAKWTDYGGVTGIRIDIRGTSSAVDVLFDHVAVLKSVNPLEITSPSEGEHTYYVTQVSGQGCGASEAASQTINVHNITVNGITASQDALCGGGEDTLTANVSSTTDEPETLNYVWKNGIGAEVGNTNPITVSPSENTTYTVSASVPDVGCTATATKTVNVHPALNPGAVSSGSKIVARNTSTGSVTVSNTTPASGGQGTITYQWKYRKNNGNWQNVTSNGTGQNLTFNINTYSGSNGTYEFTRWAINASCAPDGEMAVGQYTLTVGDTIRLDSSVVVTRIDCWGGGGSGGRYSTSNNARRGGTGGGGGGYAALTPINNEAYIPYAVIPYDVTLIVTSAARQTNTASQGNPSTVSFTRGTTTLYTVTASGGGAGSSGTTPASGGTATISATTTQIPTGYRVTNTGGTGGTGTSTSSGNGQNRTYYYYGGGGGGAAGPSITNEINGKSATKSGNTGSAGSGGTGYCTIDGNSGAGATGQANSTSAAIGSAYGGGGGGRGGNSGNVYGAAGIVVVTLKTVPSATITQPSAICENTSLSITPTISWGDGTSQSKKWQISSGTTASDFGDISNLNNIPYSYNNRYIRLAVTTEYGTRYSNAVQISVKQKQHPLFDLSKEYCPSNQAIALSEFANNSDGIHEGGIRGSWATTAAPSTPITSLPGDNTGASDLSYSIKFTHNNDYCAFDTTFTITVWAKPSVSLSSNKDQTVCQGTSIGNITITANNANAADWSFNKGGDNSSLTRSGQTISGTMANAGTFNYSVTVSSAHTSCTHTASATGTVTVTPYNTITLTSASTTDNQTVCNHSNIVNITYSTTGATGADFSNLPAGVSGSWNNNVVTISGTPTEGGTFTYTVTMTGGCTGGTNTATGTITVNDPQITLQALRDTTVCSGNQVKMEAVVAAHQSDNITYAWYKDGGTTAYKTVSSFTEEYNTTTSYRLVATASKTMNGKQCSVSDEKSATITITNPAVTNLNITANPASICYEDSSTLTASCNYTGGSISYSWTGAGLGQTSGAVVKAGATGTAGSTTEYTVTATATSGSCTATDTHTVTVTVNPKVVMNTPSPVTICHNVGVNIPFSNSGTGLVEADMRYTWTSSNANVGGLTPGTVTSTGIVASALTNTTTQPQTTTIEVTPKYLHNGIECTGTPVNFTITVKPEVKMNEPVVSPNTTICHGGSISMTFSPSLTGGTTTYSWTRNNTDVVGGTDHGNGNIVNLTLTNTNSTFKQTTFKVTPIFEGCTATASGQREITVSVNPKVVMDTPSDTRICHNDNLNVNFTTSMTGGETTYSWTRDNTTSVGGTASGNGDISGLKLTNTTNQAQVTTFEVTPTYKHNGVSCTGTPITFNVTVNPQVKMKHVADQTLCHNTSSTAVTLTSPITDGTVSYSWYRDNTTNITGLVNSGTSSTLAAATALNNTATVQTTTYRVTPTYTNGISCTMTGDSTFKITVYPSVSLAQVDAQYVSHDSIKKIQLQSGNSTDGSISYTWNRTSVANVTGSENGSGNTLSDLMQIKLSNTNDEPKTVTFTVTPTYHNNGKDCQGATMSFNVTVNPKVTMKIAAPTNPNQTICSGDNIEQVTFGTELSLNTERTIVYNWTRTSESGVSGLEGPGQGNIAATAMSNSNSEPKTVTFTVTPRYTANSITIDGETKTFTITVNPEVKMNPISDKTLCNGEGLNVEFGTTLTVGTTSYTWTRNNTDVVGGTDHGNGNIENLILTNSNTIYKTTTFTVTPTFTYGGKTCTATQTNEQQFTVTVNPTVQMATPANDTICHNEQLNVAFSTSYTGGTVTYAWSRDNDNVGGTTSGNGNISNLTLTNTTNSPQTTEFTVTPTYTNGESCTGTVVKFKVTVNPQVKMNHVADQTLCHGDNMTAVNFASALASANTRMSYAWNRDNTGNVTGLAGNGNGNIASTQLSNNTTADQTSTFKVKPTYTFGKACTMTGDSTFKIVVNPKVVMVTPADVTMCNDSLLNVTFQSNLTPGTTSYTWNRVGSDVTGTASGSGNIQNLKLTNNTTSAKTTTFTVTPTYTSNGKACTDENAQFVVTVYPRVQMDAIGNQHKCSGEDIAAVNFVHHITDGNVTFEWTRDNANVQGLGGLTGAVTADHIDVTTVTNTTNLPQVTTIKVTPIYRNGTTVCRGEQRSFTITVNPEVKMDAVSSQSLCEGSTLTVDFGSQLSGGTMSYSWNRTNGSITGIGGLTTPVSGNISATISNSTLEAQTSTFTVIPTFTYNGEACTATQSNYRTFDVTVNKNPGVVSITGDSPICSPTSIELTASSTIPSAGSFVWSGEDVSANTAFFEGFSGTSYNARQTWDVYKVTTHPSDGYISVYSRAIEAQVGVKLLNQGDYSPDEYKYIQLRYRVASTEPSGTIQVFFCNKTAGGDATGGHGLTQSYINDGNWHVMTFYGPNNDNWLNDPEYSAGRYITGVRIDARAASAVHIDYDYIALLKDTNKLVVENPSVGSHTYYVAQVSPNGCGASEAVSKTVEVKELEPGAITSGSSSIYPCENYSITNTTLAQCTSTSDVKYKWTYTFNGGTEQDIAVNESSLTQATNLVSIPGTYVFKRYAASTCDACTASGDVWKVSTGTYTLTVKAVNPGSISENTSARRICKNSYYGISEVDPATADPGHTLNYKWEVTRINDGQTDPNYRGSFFNNLNVSEFTTDNCSDCKLNETGLYIIRRYVWTGCDNGSAQESEGDFRILVLSPKDSIPDAVESNYYEICKGGVVTLTSNAESAAVIVPNYNNPLLNDTIFPRESVDFQYRYSGNFRTYTNGETTLDTVGSAQVRARFSYENTSNCYAYAKPVLVTVRPDPTFAATKATADKTTLCPSAMLTLTAPALNTTIVGEDLPYHYTWRCRIGSATEHDVSSTEATYTYIDSGRVAYASNFTVTGAYYYKVVASNDLGCNVKTSAYSAKITVKKAAPPTVSTTALCPSNEQFTFSATPESGYSLRWYDSDTALAPLSNTPQESLRDEDTITYYVSQYDATCESARVPCVLQVRYTSHLAWLDGDTVQSRPQRSEFTATAITPIRYSYSYLSDDFYAEPVVTGLPSGITGRADNGVFTISGVPTVSGNFPYTVELNGEGCPQPVELHGVLTVYPTYDTTVYYAACGLDSFVVKDNWGHRYVVNEEGAFVFGNPNDKPLQTVLGYDSVVIVVYTNYAWNQFGYESETKTIAAWNTFSTSRGIPATSGVNQSSALITWPSDNNWPMSVSQDNLTSNTCVSTAGNSLGIPNRAASDEDHEIQEGWSIVFKINTEDFANINLSFDYQINQKYYNGFLGLGSGIDIAFRTITLSYSHTGYSYQNIADYNLPFESVSGQDKQVTGIFSKAISLISNRNIEDKDTLYIKMAFSNQDYFKSGNVAYLVLDNICFTGQKAIKNLDITINTDTVCTDGYISLEATPPYVNLDGDEPDTMVVAYTWERLVNGTSTIFSEGRMYNVSDVDIPVGHYQYVARVGHGICRASDTVSVYGAIPTYDLETVHNAWVCANQVERIENFTFTDPDCQYVEGMSIRKPAIDSLRVPGVHRCWLTIPYEGNACGDSIISLDLEVRRAVDTSIVEHICIGDVYDKYGIHYVPTSVGNITLTSPHGTCTTGCDSVYTVNLWINSIEQTLSPEYNLTLAAWRTNSTRYSYPAYNGVAMDNSSCKLVSYNSDQTRLNVSPGENDAVKLGNILEHLCGQRGRGRSEPESDPVSTNPSFELKVNPRDYNNLRLKFDYKRENDNVANGQAFNQVSYFYKFGAEDNWIPISSKNINVSGSWTTETIDFSTVASLDTDCVYLKIDFSGGTVNYGSCSGGVRYYTSYITVDNLVIVGDKPVRAHLSEPLAYIHATEDTLRPGESAEFCERNAITFIAQENESYFNEPYFTYWLRDSYTGNMWEFETNTLTLPEDTFVRSTTWEVLARSEYGCDTVFKFPVRIDSSANGINNSIVYACSATEFTFTPQNGVDGVVPSNVTYSWDAPDGGDYVRGTANGTNSSSIYGTLYDIDTVDYFTQLVEYIVTPTVSGCGGRRFTVSVVVHPKVTGSIIAPESGTEYCPGEEVTYKMEVDHHRVETMTQFVWDFEYDVDTVYQPRSGYERITNTARSTLPPRVCNVDYTVTATYSDSAHCTVSDAITVKAVDRTPPTFTRPKDTVLYVTNIAVAESDTLPSATGEPTDKSDLCSTTDDMFTVTHRDSIVAVCGHAEKIYRIWRVADACGNVAVSDSVQFINILDTVKLTVTGDGDTSQIKCYHKSIEDIVFGGQWTSLTINPSTLPANLQFSSSYEESTGTGTGTLSGALTDVGILKYTVTAANPCDASPVTSSSKTHKTMTGTITHLDTLIMTVIVDSAECGNANGTVMASATGGLMPYRYQIDGGSDNTLGIFNDLSEDGHTVTLTDSLGCPYNESVGDIKVDALDVQDIKGVTRYGQLTDYDPDGNMIDRYGNLDTVPHLNQYGAVIPHDRTMSNLMATSTAGSHAIVVSVNVDKKANAHTLEFQYSTDGTNFAPYGSKKITNLTNGTTYSHTFPNLVPGRTYYVRVILRTCHEETVTEMVTVEVQ